MNKKHIKKLQSILSKGLNKDGNKLNNKDTIRRKIQKHFNKIKNLVKELHNKVVLYLVKKYDIILIPEFSTKNMISNKDKFKFVVSNNPNLNVDKEELKNKFGNKIIIKEESYTSKCDVLALETIQHQEVYLGKRTKRGLFCSSKNKLLNADINGAINIMRKVINLTEITGQIYNPIRVNIICEVTKPAE